MRGRWVKLASSPRRTSCGGDEVDAGSYGSAGNCSSCPAFSSSRAGSRSIEDCFCHAGFGVRATGYSRQVTSPHDQCELIKQEMFVGSQPGASCSAVCGSRNLACLDEAQPILPQQDLSALLSSWSLPVSKYVGSNSADAPSYNPVTGQAFYRNGLPGTCSASNANNVRVCRCTCANNQYGMLPPASPSSRSSAASPHTPRRQDRQLLLVPRQQPVLLPSSGSVELHVRLR